MATAARRLAEPMISGDYEAALIQIVAEWGRGLEILDRDLRRGNFTASRQTVKGLSHLTTLADQIIKTAGRAHAEAPGPPPAPARLTRSRCRTTIYSRQWCRGCGTPCERVTATRMTLTTKTPRPSM